MLFRLYLKNSSSRPRHIISVRNTPKGKLSVKKLRALTTGSYGQFHVSHEMYRKHTGAASNKTAVAACRRATRKIRVCPKSHKSTVAAAVRPNHVRITNTSAPSCSERAGN